MNETFTITGTQTYIFRDVTGIPLEDQKPGVGKITRVKTYKNVFPNVAKAAVAAQLAGDQTYDLGITYIAVGTGSGSFDGTETTMFTELARVANSVDGSAANVSTIQGFFNSATGNGVLTEGAAFGDGSASQATASADTGVLFSHSSISETKTAGETLTLQVTHTIT